MIVVSCAFGFVVVGGWAGIILAYWWLYDRERTTVRMLTDAPAAKVNAATIASAVTTILLYLLKAYVIKDGPALPEPIELAIGLLITAAITAGATFLAGYFTPPAGRDTIVPDVNPQ